MSESQEVPSGLMPVSIDREGQVAIVIQWNDDTTTRWSISDLRQSCPCATCREKKKGDEAEAEQKPAMLPVLTAAEARPLSIESMKPVGSYAYNIAFSDGHSSGIFPFEMLYKP